MAFQKKTYHKEENCLNCGYPLVGKYCGNCGQKAFLHKDSFVHMAIHFLGDYFHYDNKFWNTLKALMLKPGLVTTEFNEGKRAKYLGPIQLYIFITTVFFIFFFSSNKHEPLDIAITDNGRTIYEQTDSIALSKADSIINSGVDSAEQSHIVYSKEKVDSIKALMTKINPSDNFAERFIKNKTKNLGGKNSSIAEMNQMFQEKLMHNIPKMFFILLPFFALILKLVNYRKKILYIDHLVFSIHFHSLVFITIGLLMLLNHYIDNEVFKTISYLTVILGIGVYLFLALYHVYHSSIIKTLIKQFLLFFLYMIGFIIALALVLTFTFATL